MTAPYTQQNYADWKARFQQTSAVGGLLRQAKQAAGIEEEQTPPPMPQMLQPQPIPEAPLTEADTHEHRKGLLGKVRHLFGADRIAPEVAALIQPDQRKRLLNQGLFSQFIDGGEQKIARQMLDLGDEKKARDLTAQQEATARRIEAVAATMSPQDGAEYAARMKGIYGLPSSTMATQAAVGLKEREFAPQRVTWTTVPMMVNGKQAMVMRSNDGQLLDAASGMDLREMGARMEPMPSNGSFATPSGLTGPNGRPMVMNNQTGRMEEAPEGVTRETAATGRSGFGVPAMRKQSVELQAIIDNAEAAIAEAKRYPQAFGLTRASETLNPRIDPKGNEARRLFGRVASITRHETFGAALTPTEAATARSWVGRTMDPADKIVGDLENLLRWAKAKKADLDGEVQTLDRPAAPRAGAPAPAAGGKTITVNGKTFIIP